MPLLPADIRQLARRAIRLRASGVAVDRLLDALAIDPFHPERLREEFPELTERELRSLFHAMADLARGLDNIVGSDRKPLAAAPPLSSVDGRLWGDPGPLSARLQVEGRSSGNPGPAGVGVVFLADDGALLGEHCEAVGRQTIHAAEYIALREGLTLALRHGLERVHAFAASQLLERQIRGAYRVKSAGLKPLHAEVAELISYLERFELTHVDRAENRRAGELANLAIQSG